MQADETRSVRSMRSTAAANVLGEAPPSKNYHKLRLWSECLEHAEKNFSSCTTRDEMKGVEKDIKNMKLPMVELLVVTKASLKDAKAALTAALKRRSQQPGEPSKKANPKAAIAKLDQPPDPWSKILAALEKHATGLQSLSVSELSGALSLTEPVIVRMVTFALSCETAVAEIQSFADEFGSPSHSLRQGRGRTQRVLSPAGVKELVPSLSKLLGAEAVQKASVNETGISAHVFGFVKNKATIYMEGMGKGITLRWSWQGKRKVCLLPLKKLQQAMEKVGLNEPV